LEYYPDPQKALSEQNTRKDINEKMAKIAAKQQEIAQLKQGLEDLEDQLRKSHGDPGGRGSRDEVVSRKILGKSFNSKTWNWAEMLPSLDGAASAWSCRCAASFSAHLSLVVP